MSKFSTQSQSLDDWLLYLESIHPSEIKLGVTRVKSVAQKLGLLNPRGKIIIVGGTNGKGSTCAFLEHLILATGATTGVFSSPHVIRYNERVRINTAELDDHSHVDAMRLIEQQRGDVCLTYFEYNTLVALKLMNDHDVDFLILEVGLGGRLDSTNIVDADLAIITSIDLDHQSWLGDTREQVATEKAGIFRVSQLVVCGEPNPPQTLIDHANSLNCMVSYKGKQFSFKQYKQQSNQQSKQHWSWHSAAINVDSLPATKLPTTNAATALEAFKLLGLSLPHDKLVKVLGSTALPGRLQSISQLPEVVLDVAHNPEAGRYLASWLSSQTQYSRVHCVCAMLGDKDSQSTLSVVEPYINQWYLADLDCHRGAKATQLQPHVDNEKVVGCFDNVSHALLQAQQSADENDLILVFGSFYTVCEVLQQPKYR
ncbi:MAG: bifunctional tetrahydrofolate synthase/dihydrofolate synthase [Gammaproteobacteria bacterium]|nr:bifunctional tetrahydrofolate synthase/dihydrofolate synthase [Gammaproteobacteria bacterium]